MFAFSISVVLKVSVCVDIIMYVCDLICVDHYCVPIAVYHHVRLYVWRGTCFHVDKLKIHNI